MSDTGAKFHSALSITNVKSLVPFTLDIENGPYHSWVALFKVQARVHNLMHHIIPPTEVAAKAKIDALRVADPELYDLLDAAVLQWIYGTISPELLQAILVKDDTVAKSWQRLETIFKDNKGSRATHLEEELAAVSLEKISSADAYCNHVKTLADKLADVDAPVANSRLVLWLIGGLPQAYSGTVDFVQNQDPLPPFENVQSRIKLAERTLKNRLSKEAGGTATFIASTGGAQPGNMDHVNSNHQHNYSSNSNHGRNNNTKNKKKIIIGRTMGKTATLAAVGVARTVAAAPTSGRLAVTASGSGVTSSSHTPYGQWPQQWAAPPCPYPTAPMQQQHPAMQPGNAH
ncbi:uncharacterized protein LOC132608141 [Lycium barbarum]|uniref:uncharacterized protein LOC132608141 n=1 Tax=Lycium barbarum TaxID=112863 RepID=UPI00293E6836|nr:uncharacterized protein LOC132608141 [Lycium barbarum]